MIYRIAQPQDYLEIAVIHQISFSDFFLTSLGNGFLKTYYKACLRSDESVSICVLNDINQIVGFAIGCLQSQGFHKRLVGHNFFSFAFRGIILAVTRPISLIRLLKNFNKAKNEVSRISNAELLSIAIHPMWNGKGIGIELLKQFEIEVQKSGGRVITLTTDSNNNYRVLEFYKKSGYGEYYKFRTYPNREMHKLIKELN